MKLNGRKFGIEIEFLAPYGNSDRGGYPINRVAEKLRAAGIPLIAESQYLSGQHHKRGDFTNWMLGTDSSLSGSGVGLELATAPLKTDADVQRLKKALKVLLDLGCKINDSCGLHVHHEVDLRTFDVEKMIQYIVPAQTHLHGILKRERQGNEYCKDWTPGEALRKYERNSDRRKFVNFLPFYSNQPHIEFRAHHGSLKFAEIMNWVCITQRVVEVSQKGIERRSAMPESIENMLGQPRSFDDLKRRLQNFGHDYDDATLLRHLQEAQKIEIAGTSYYYIPSDKAARFARELNLERGLARYFLGKSQMKKEFGDV